MTGVQTCALPILFTIFILGPAFLDFNLFKKAIIIFCIVLATFVILQFVVFSISGFLIPGFILDAELNDGGITGRELYNNYLNYANVSGYLKPNGFLCEPAHAAQCLFLGLILTLFSRDVNKSIQKGIYISLAMFVTMSTSAIVYTIFAWILWLSLIHI